MNVPVNIFQKKCKKNIHNRLNVLQLEIFKLLCLFVEQSLLKNIDKEKHKTLCSSNNNSKSINQYIENITRIRLPEFLTDINTKWKEYCGEHMADTSLTLKDCVIHVDNKGVEVKIKEMKLKKKEMKQLCDDNTISYKELENKKKRIGYEELLTQHGLSFVKDTTEYIEFMGDHKDANLHFKSSQTNLYGFEGKALNKICIFNGKMPKYIQCPHFTYIIKHVYSEEKGIHKIVLYSIPHCYSQPKYYPKIQYNSTNKQKIRIPKAPDEFRFNMNDSNDKPYTFIDSDIPRYKVFTYTSS